MSAIRCELGRCGRKRLACWIRAQGWTLDPWILEGRMPIWTVEVPHAPDDDVCPDPWLDMIAAEAARIRAAERRDAVPKKFIVEAY